MYIKDEPRNKYNRFELDMDKIELTSVSEKDIKLPYTGKLPDAYDTATLYIRVTAEYLGVNITATKGKKEKRYVVVATRDEIESILQPFFFFQLDKTTQATRFKNGLSEYWTGKYQSEYFVWHLLNAQPERIISAINALEPEKRTYFFRLFDRYRAEIDSSTGDAPAQASAEESGEEQQDGTEDGDMESGDAE